MKQKTYLEITNKEESRLTQEYLFAMGYKWAGEDIPKVRHEDKPHLVVYKGRKIIRFIDAIKIHVQRKAKLKGYDYIRGYKFISPLWKVLNG